MKLQERKMREIRALAEASAEALVATALASRKRHAKNTEITARTK